jgi:allantoinase
MSAHLPYLLRSQRVCVSPDAAPEPACLAIEGGKIVGIVPFSGYPSGYQLLDFGESVVMAGVVDTHAHINEPGRTEWEGFETACRAAASGGITTVIDMPLNSIPPTTTVAALEAKSQAARGKCAIDYGFWGGVIPGNLAELGPLVDKGVWGFKAFLCESGVEEFPMSREPDLRAAMEVLSKRGVPLLVHAELDLGAPETAAPEARRYSSYLASRPSRWEVEAIRLMIRLCRETKCAVHVVHLSASEALPDLAAARAEGLQITVETCPHYLTLRAEEIADGATHFKCAPPIRGKENQDKLWAGLESGVIDQIVSDHSPCTPALKRLQEGHFGEAWGGIAGLQFSLPVVWTEMKRRGYPVQKLTRWMSEAPARLLGLGDKKGSLAPGHDADIVVWSPEEEFTVEPSRIRHRHSLTPYEGKRLSGVVEATYLRGVCLYESGQLTAESAGEELRRPGETT